MSAYTTKMNEKSYTFQFCTCCQKNMLVLLKVCVFWSSSGCAIFLQIYGYSVQTIIFISFVCWNSAFPIHKMTLSKFDFKTEHGINQMLYDKEQSFFLLHGDSHSILKVVNPRTSLQSGQPWRKSAYRFHGNNLGMHNFQ